MRPRPEPIHFPTEEALRLHLLTDHEWFGHPNYRNLDEEARDRTIRRILNNPEPYGFVVEYPRVVPLHLPVDNDEYPG